MERTEVAKEHLALSLDHLSQSNQANQLDTQTFKHLLTQSKTPPETLIHQLNLEKQALLTAHIQRSELPTELKQKQLSIFKQNLSTNFHTLNFDQKCSVYQQLALIKLHSDAAQNWYFTEIFAPKHPYLLTKKAAQTTAFFI
jgi:hypothetical protein